MEKQHLKRLGYGFSALVMTLSAVTFYPSFNNAAYAEDATCTAEGHLENNVWSALDVNDAVVCLDGTLELTSKLNITKNVTIDLNGNKITQTGLDTIFKVTGTLTIIDSVGGGSIVAHDGKGITGTGSTGTINVKGGTFSGKFNKADNGTLNVTGGVFNYEVTPANGYAAYVLDEEAGTYYVAEKLGVWSAVSADTISVNKARNIATYSIVKDYDGEEMKPEVVVTLDGVEATEEDYMLSYANYNTERNVVKATLNKVGRYVFTVKGADDATANTVLKSYEIAEENIDGKVYNLVAGGEAKDLTDDFGVNPASAIKEVVSDKDTVAKVETADGKWIVTPVKAGTAKITVTLGNKTTETMTFAVNVYNTNATSYLIKAGEEVKNSLNASPWSINPELPEDGILASAVVTAPATLNGASSLTLKGAKAGSTTLTLKSDEEGTVTKNVKVNVYEVAEAVAMAKGTTLNTLSEKIVKLPEGFAVENIVEADGADGAETSVALNGAGEDQIFTAVSAGSKTYAYTVKKGSLVAEANVTVYVYGEASEIETQTVKLDGELDIAGLYTPASASSEVTYAVEGDGAKITEGGVFTSTGVGEKKVIITETLAGEAIAETPVAVNVYGIILPEVEVEAGKTVTVKLADYEMAFTTIDNNYSMSNKIEMKVTEDGYSFTAAKDAGEGEYTVAYEVTYDDGTEDGETETVYQTIKTVEAKPDKPGDEPSDEPGKDDPKPGDDEKKDDEDNKGGENKGDDEKKDDDNKGEDKPSDKPSDEPSDKPSDEPTDEPSDDKKFDFINADVNGAIKDDLDALKAAYEAMTSAKTSAEKIAATEKLAALTEEFRDRFYDDYTADEVIEAARNGATITTEVRVNKWELPEEDAPYYEEYVEYIEDLKAQFGFGTYLGDVEFYEVYINVLADGRVIGGVSEPDNTQTIVLSVGSPENGFSREFKVVRRHWNNEGVAEYEEIEDWTYDPETGELTFKSDKFSTFAVGHLDVAASPDTGKATAETASASANATLAIVSAIAAITLAGAAVFAKRK